MKKQQFLTFLIFFCIFFQTVLPVFAANERRSLFINRSLLTKAEAEYQELLKKEASEPSEELSKRISNLRLHIQVLQEDAVRLRNKLPKSAQADEFLKEVVHRRMALGSAQPINTEQEKEIDKKVTAIHEMHEKALSYVEKKQYDKAAHLYEEIILLNPDDEEAYLLLGHTNLAAGRYERAGQAFRNALNINPKNFEEIPRLYQNILVDNPQDDEAMTQLGFAHLLLGNASLARKAFEDALRINPASVEARRGLMELQ